MHSVYDSMLTYSRTHGIGQDLKESGSHFASVSSLSRSTLVQQSTLPVLLVSSRDSASVKLQRLWV